MCDMDINDENVGSRKCFKYKERLFGHLNIAHDESRSLFVLWNQYQIFIHEDQNLERPTRIIVPEFQISQVIASNNYLICLDSSGNIHVTSMKFKNSTQKRFKTGFQPKEQGVLWCVKYSPDHVLSIKEDAQTYFLCLNKITTDFQLEKKTIVQTKEKDWPPHPNTKKEIILNLCPVSKDKFPLVQALFSEEVLWKDHGLILISFDKLTIFACLLNLRDDCDTTELVKLYSCPTYISNFTIIEDNNTINLVVGMKTGTLIQIPFETLNKHPKTNVVHLNAALSKFLAIKPDTLIYTDGITMWRSQNTYSKDCVSFQQLFTKDVKDFIKLKDLLICTTYTDMIYTFSIENECSYLKSSEDIYCPADKLLSNSECLYKITEEIKRNEEILNEINKEENYITAISLSKRQDLLDSVINYKAVVYENYQDVVNDKKEVILTENLEEYFRRQSSLILIKIATSAVQHALSHILTNLFSDLILHITLFSPQKVFKTTSLKLKEQLKKLHILIPLCEENIAKLCIEIKIVYRIPGIYDKEQGSWIILHNKLLELNAEHFIKTNPAKKITSLREHQRPIEELIQKVAENQHGDILKISDLSETKIAKSPLVFYVKLPENYKEVLSNETYYNKHLNPEKAVTVLNLVTSEEFLKSKNSIILEISKAKVHLDIINDEFFNPLLRVSSEDGNIALDVRNFFANVVHGDLCGFQSGKEFISNSLYTTAENLQKAVKKCVNGAEEEILTLSEQFQKNIIGALPI